MVDFACKSVPCIVAYQLQVQFVATVINVEKKTAVHNRTFHQQLYLSTSSITVALSVMK